MRSIVLNWAKLSVEMIDIIDNWEVTHVAVI